MEWILTRKKTPELFYMYRPDDCSNGFYRSKCNDPEEAIRRWNEWVAEKTV